MARFGIALAFSCLLIFQATAQVAIVGSNKSLQELADTGAYVTVTLSIGGNITPDRNLRIVAVHDDYISVITPKGERSAYSFKHIKDIRVQDGKMAEREPMGRITALRAEDEDVIQAAVTRTQSIFRGAETDQQVKMHAAAVWAGSPSDEAPQALAYLRALGEVNDLRTQIAAGPYIYVVGESLPSGVVRQGLDSGNIRTKGDAASLAGLFGYDEFEPQIVTMMNDPRVEVFPSAARAAGRLGLRSTIPQLMEALASLNEEKAEAAAFALTRLGGTDVLRSIENFLKEESGWPWFRAAKVQFALDPQAGGGAMRQALQNPSFGPEAATILARSGDYEAANRLRAYLDRAQDPDRENLLFRVEAAAALYLADYAPAKTMLQQLLAISENDVYAGDLVKQPKDYKQETVKLVQLETCAQIAQLGERTLLSLLRPAMGSTDEEVALSACQATIAIADPEYGNRLSELLRED